MYECRGERPERKKQAALEKAADPARLDDSASEDRDCAL